MFLINLHFPFSTVVIVWTAYTVYPSCAMQLSGVIPLRNGPCVVIVTALPGGLCAHSVTAIVMQFHGGLCVILRRNGGREIAGARRGLRKMGQ